MPRTPVREPRHARGPPVGIVEGKPEICGVAVRGRPFDERACGAHPTCFKPRVGMNEKQPCSTLGERFLGTGDELRPPSAG